MAYVLSTAWIVPGKTNRLREWYAELKEHPLETLDSLDNERVRQEIAFILNTEHGDLLCVFLEVDDMERANEPSSPPRSRSITSTAESWTRSRSEAQPAGSTRS